MRVDQTQLINGLGQPNISYGSSTGLLDRIPTLVWNIPQTGMHITIYPDDAWKSAEMVRKNDLRQRRLAALEQDDAEALALIKGWRQEGKNDDEIERLLGESPIEFDPTLEEPPLNVGAVTFDEWHLTHPQSGSAWFNLTGKAVKSDSAVALQYARNNASYFAWFGLPVATQ